MPKAQLYDSLDAPVYVWDKIHSQGDMSYLIVNRKKVKSVPVSDLQAAFDRMYNEYIDEFGFGESFKSIKMKEIEIARLKCKLVQTDDRSFETEIEIAELELEEMKKDIEGSKLTEIKIAIEKKMGFQLNMMTTSIRDFYTYLKAVN